MKNNNIHKTPPSFGGIYKDWNEAKKIGDGLISRRWLKRIYDQLKDYKKELQKDKYCEPTRPSDLPLICNVYKPKTIIDFGGSSGWLWHYVKASNTNNTIKKYIIIETKEVCEFAKTKKINTKPISYNTIENFTGSCDIFYCNSVLQYFDKENLFLDFVKNVKPKIVLLEDLYVGDFKDFYTSQIYYEDRIPVKFRNMHNFLKLFNKIGYRAIFTKPYISSHRGIVQPIPMDGFPKNKRLLYAKTVLLRKI